jgi:DnaJ-class molecular chaperone
MTADQHECPHCDGQGELFEDTGIVLRTEVLHSTRQVTCDACDGSGMVDGEEVVDA